MSNQLIRILRIAGIGLLLFYMGCNQTDHSTLPVKDTTKVEEKPTSSIEVNDTIFAGDRDTTILLKNGEAIIQGHIIANKNKPSYIIAGLKAQTVTALLRPVKKEGNVRIIQVQQPGGAFDGPFGDSLRYTFKKSGKLRFIIGENLMAGDPYTGDFILHIRLGGQ